MDIKLGLFGTCSAILFFSAMQDHDGPPLRTSDNGLIMILGYESCRLEPYRCSSNVLTDGVGNTFDVVIGKKITETQAASAFIENVRHFERGLENMIKVPVTAHVWDSIVSFTYNIGLTQFSESTLLKKLNGYDIDGACNEMQRWIYSNGVPLSGLIKRRAAEREFCLDGSFSGDIADFRQELLDLGLIDE